MVARIRIYAEQAGRDPGTIGLERRINAADPPDNWATTAAEWRALGGTHLSVNTMRAGLASPGAHIEAMRRVREALVKAGAR
jgi:hypothetical protein